MALRPAFKRARIVGQSLPIGLIPAALIVLVLPEKLQFVQEYRYLFYGIMVIAILLFRPDGLLPRKTRLFFKRNVKREVPR